MNDGWLWLSILNTAAWPSPMSITPAFSPGPQIPCGASVGRVFKCRRDDLYEQCSLHITEKMPSSVRLGVRLRRWTMRANSSALSPNSSASASVDGLVLNAGCSRQRLDQAGEQATAVGR